MFRSTTIIATLAIACLANSVSADEPTDVEKAFQEYGKLMVGVWTQTDDDGNIKEHEYRWIANKKYIQATLVKDKISGTGIIGIDPETKKLTAWWFANGPELGTLKVKVAMTKIGDNEWSTEAKGFMNNDVPYSAKGTFTLTDNKLVGGGQTEKVGDQEQTRPGDTWTRIRKGTE